MSAEERKQQVKAGLQRAGFLATDEEIEVDKSCREMAAHVLRDPTKAPTSLLILCFDPVLLVRAIPPDVDEEQGEHWVGEALATISEEIDRRFPVPT